MDTFDIVFYAFAILAVGSASVVVFSRNIVHSALALLFTFVAVAGLYVLLHADFLAVTQVLIYVGGILVLLLFGIMLTSRAVDIELKTGALHVWPARVLTAFLAGTLAGIFYATWKVVDAPAPAYETTTAMIGTELMTSWLLPFEVASVILLVALVGAAFIARRRRAERRA
jgi:NADH-quinone oxidoreductase subunit J